MHVESSEELPCPKSPCLKPRKFSVLTEDSISLDCNPECTFNPEISHKVGKTNVKMSVLLFLGKRHHSVRGKNGKRK